MHSSCLSLVLNALVIVLGAPALFAEIRMDPASYEVGGVTLKSVLVYDTDQVGQRPGIVVFPEWWGLNDYPKSRARMLAGLGYVALVADVYGQGVNTDDPKKAGELAGAVYKDPAAMVARAQAALAALRNSGKADPAHLGAIGYCFGGSIALHLARSGADLNAVVAFHAGLANHLPPSTVAIKPAILVCNGAEDKMVGKDEYSQFMDEMRARKAVWQLTLYSDALHAFTNPLADRHKELGIGYNQRADKRSWEDMRQFLKENFGE